MRLSAFIAGIFGAVGFALSIVAGVLADNAFDSIAVKALISCVACYLVGYVVGAAAEQVSREHAVRVAEQVARADAERQAQEDARKAQEAADAVQAPTGVGSGAPGGASQG